MCNNLPQALCSSLLDSLLQKQKLMRVKSDYMPVYQLDFTLPVGAASAFHCRNSVQEFSVYSLIEIIKMYELLIVTGEG